MNAAGAETANRKPLVLGAVALSVAALVVLVVVLATRGDSLTKWIPKKYSKVSAGTYRSPKPPQQVGNEITKKFKAVDRVDDLAQLGTAGGVFLQYPKTLVGVLPDGTGSRITVDRPNTGYSRYHSHVGRHWSTPGSNGWNSRGGAAFRGGGPGSGK